MTGAFSLYCFRLLHIVAFVAVTGDREGLFVLVVAGAAGFALLHVGHAGLAGKRLVLEDLGMAVSTLVHLGMEFMAELGIADVDLVGHRAGFQSLVALGAISGHGEGVFTGMTDTTGLALFHLGHTHYAGGLAVLEHLAVAVGALVHLGMEVMAELGWRNPLGGKVDIFRLQPLVAAITVASHGKGGLAVVTGATGSALFHFRHGYPLFLAGDNLAVVAAFTGSAGLGDMRGMAEGRLSQALELVGNLPRLALVAA